MGVDRPVVGRDESLRQRIEFTIGAVPDKAVVELIDAGAEIGRGAHDRVEAIGTDDEIGAQRFDGIDAVFELHGDAELGGAALQQL